MRLRRHPRFAVRGFSLIEVMIALLVVAFASLGAVVSILASSRELRDGQLRVHASALVDARLQRYRLQDKLALNDKAIDFPTLPSEVIGSSPWVADTANMGAPDAGDLSSGPLFIVLADGTISPCTASTRPACATTPALCSDTAIPRGVYCREVVVTKGASVTTPGAIVMPGTLASTVWVRVTRKGDPITMTADGGMIDSRAIVSREVMAQ